MSKTHLFIKNMVCNRCIKVVKDELVKMGLSTVSVELGEVHLLEPISEDQLVQLNEVLQELGFALLDDKKGQLIERTKKLIIALAHQKNNLLKTNLSDYLSEHLAHDYNYISHLFSELEGTTIEKYFISQKIEKVKELLVYDELSLSEIAYQLNYSSVAHLSNQFKNLTGFTPSHFKKIKGKRRRPLDEI